MQQQTVDGVTLAVHQKGAGEPVVLFHPGFVADGFAPLLLEPALAHHRLVAYHRRGYGASEPGAVSIERHAGDALALMRALAIERAHLVGHSVGANVALELALSEPKAVRSLALLEPLLPFALSQASGEFIARTAAIAYSRLDSGDVSGALDAWLSGAFGGGYRDVLDRSLPGAFDAAVRDATAPFRGEVPAVQGWERGLDDLGRLEVPTLSVLGADSTWPGFRETHEALLDRVPDVRGMVVSGATHLLQIANPSAVAETLAAFLAAGSITAPAAR